MALDKSRRVVCAAMRHPTIPDLIVCGPRHHDKSMRIVLHAIRGVVEGEEDHDTAKWEQGFVNTWAEFLTREEAWEVACEHKQIFRLCGGQVAEDGGKSGVKLYSENLY